MLKRKSLSVKRKVSCLLVMSLLLTVLFTGAVPGYATEDNRDVDTTSWAKVQHVIDSTVAPSDEFSTGLKGGVINFNPSKIINVPFMLNVDKMRVDLDGGNSILKWTGTDPKAAMIRVYDSSFVKIKNFSLIGDAANPPLAAILFDNDNLAIKGTNEKCVVEDVIIGRKYLADTDSGGSINKPGTIPYGQVQNGIYVSPNFYLSGNGRPYGNNDEFTFRNVVVNDALDAGFRLQGDQHIWTSFENCLANGNKTGYFLGCNVTMYNVQANRNTGAAFWGVRNIEVPIFGMYAEHPNILIESQSASFFVRGGKVMKNPTEEAPLIKYNAGGSLKLEDVTITYASNNGGKGFNYVDYNGGNVKDGIIEIKNSPIRDGDNRRFWRIHTATNGMKQTKVDIEVGNFKFKTEMPYYDQANLSTSVSANGRTLISSSIPTGTQMNTGKFFSTTLDQPLGLTQIGTTIDTSTLHCRLLNRDSAVKAISTGRLRALRLEDRILSIGKKAAAIGNIGLNNQYLTEIPTADIKLGDFVVPSSDTAQKDVTLHAYASSEDKAKVIVENSTEVELTVGNMDLKVAKLDESKFALKSSKLVEEITINNGSTAYFDINVGNVQLGAHCFAAYTKDLQGLIVTAHCESNGVIRVVMHNKTGDGVTLPAGTLKVMAAF